MVNMKIILLALFLVLMIGCAQTGEDSVTITDVDDIDDNTTDDDVEDEDTTDDEDTESDDNTTDDDVEDDDTTDDEDTESDDNTTDDEVVEEIDVDNGGSGEIIEIEDLQFKPKEMTIDIGTTIKWIHNDKFADNDKIKHIIRVYRVGESFDLQSEPLFFGDSFEYTFDEPGTYRYISIVYAARGTEGNLIVE